LTGNGAAPPQHSVNLSWNETSTVVGYNVYRGSQSGGPYTKINSALDASTTYSDGSVQAGQIYYYVTSAVDSSGAESGYSSQIQASVPSP
jgi:fibronectin type 3 domain-containing protein